MRKITIILALLCAAAFAQQKGSFTDPRDKKTYKTVKIGKQTWMAENLNYNAKGSKCYDNKPDNCEKYGRLYDWNEAVKACPKNWHLPTQAEWTELMNFLVSNKKDVRYVEKIEDGEGDEYVLKNMVWQR